MKDVCVRKDMPFSQSRCSFYSIWERKSKGVHHFALSILFVVLTKYWHFIYPKRSLSGITQSHSRTIISLQYILTETTLFTNKCVTSPIVPWHNGRRPLHWPLAKHMRTCDPPSSYPGWQLNWQTLSIVFPVQFMFPFAGWVVDKQECPGKQDFHRLLSLFHSNLFKAKWFFIVILF